MSIQKVIRPLWMVHSIKSGNIIRVPLKSEKSSGFTLIEMLTVISIMGILMSIAIPSFQKRIIRAKEASLQNTLFVLRDVIDQYYADNGSYPENLDVLVEKRYVRSIPLDPFTNSSTTWILTTVDSDQGSAGVFDVHSGSYKVSLNGVPYNEW